MFLSSSDKSVLEDIFSHLESVHKEDLDAITKTRRMFGL
jgi:predicted small metal-binding protein